MDPIVSDVKIPVRKSLTIPSWVKSSLGHGKMISERDGTKPVWWLSKVLMAHLVSHHPPVTAFAVKIPATKIKDMPSVKLEGHCGQRTSFATSAIAVKQVGRVKITVDMNGKQEVFIIHPLPDVTVSGLLSMSVFLELLGKTEIKSASGSYSIINFVSKGWFSGEYFGLKGSIKYNDEEYCQLSGKWAEEAYYTIDDEPTVLINVKDSPPRPIQTKPLSEQDENESLKLWSACTNALKEGDYPTASLLKSEIEELQRSKRKQRKETGESWVPQHFVFVEASGDDTDGATARDPQHTGGEQSSEKGHWLLK